MSFSEFSFDARLMRNIAAQGFTAPTPIQGMAMGPALEGKDVLGLAQTGTGKTAAFVLPLLQRLIEANAPRRGPARVLVLAPTRELALQIHQTFIDLGRNTGFRSAAVFGGVGYGPQVKALSQASIIVACPGRLLDLIDRKQVNLSRVEALVADEADRMFDMGFLPDIKKIVAQLPDQRQNLFFSATMPQEVKKLFNAVLVDPFVAKISLDGPAKTVSHALYPVAPHLKTAFLTTMLKGQDHQSVLVFTRTKHRAKTLARKLCAQGFPATSLQGNLSQNKRREALDGFRKGKYQIMVATDIAARGIDCDRISHVVNFDVPDTADSYTHRVGRTGRACRSGQAMTLITHEDKIVVRAIERALGGRIERKELEGFDHRPESDARNRTNERTDHRTDGKYGDRPRKDSGARQGSDDERGSVFGQRRTSGNGKGQAKRRGNGNGSGPGKGGAGGNRKFKPRPKQRQAEATA